MPHESQLMSTVESTFLVLPSTRWTSGVYRFMGTRTKEIIFFMFLLEKEEI